jgi:hypothetical protein
MTNTTKTGRELLESAGLSRSWTLEQIESLKREYEKALDEQGAYYSEQYVEEKLRKIREGFKDFRKEAERQERLAKPVIICSHCSNQYTQGRTECVCEACDEAEDQAEARGDL